MVSVECFADLMIRLTWFHLMFDQPRDDENHYNSLVYDVSHVVGHIEPVSQ